MNLTNRAELGTWTRVMISITHFSQKRRKMGPPGSAGEGARDHIAVPSRALTGVTLVSLHAL